MVHALKGRGRQISRVREQVPLALNLFLLVCGGDGMYMLHTCVCRCACMFEYVYRSEDNVRNFPLLFSSFFVSHGLSLNLELSHWLA